MNVEILSFPRPSDWLAARNAALRTRRQHSDTPPRTGVVLKMLMSEHSPIRGLQYRWVWHDLPYWVAMHFRTHHVGIEHYISSQRNDIQHDYDRRKSPQDAPVEHECVANPQAIIAISRARLCLTASPETRQAWQMLLDALVLSSPELYSLCVKPCVYRGGICPEVSSECHYNRTAQFAARLAQYKRMFEEVKK